MSQSSLGRPPSNHLFHLISIVEMRRYQGPVPKPHTAMASEPEEAEEA